MQVNNFFIDLALRLLFIDLHFFIATSRRTRPSHSVNSNWDHIQVCYTPRLQCVTYTYIILSILKPQKKVLKLFAVSREPVPASKILHQEPVTGKGSSIYLWALPT